MLVRSIPWIRHKNKSWQGFHGLRYGWLLYCPGFLRLHKPHHCCISLFCQLDIAIKSLCIFVAVSCDGVIHIGKFRKGTNNLVYSLKSHHWVSGFRLLRLHHKDSLRKRVVLERYILNESGYTDLMRNSKSIINCDFCQPKLN